MEETFSPSYNMAEDVDGGGKLFGEQDSLLETWTVIGENGLVQLLKIIAQHQFERSSRTKIQNRSRAFHHFLQVQQSSFPNS